MGAADATEMDNGATDGRESCPAHNCGGIHVGLSNPHNSPPSETCCKTVPVHLVLQHDIEPGHHGLTQSGQKLAVYDQQRPLEMATWVGTDPSAANIKRMIAYKIVLPWPSNPEHLSWLETQVNRNAIATSIGPGNPTKSAGGDNISVLAFQLQNANFLGSRRNS